MNRQDPRKKDISHKKTILLDEHTIQLLDKFGSKHLGSKNLSGSIRAMARKWDLQEATAEFDRK